MDSHLVGVVKLLIYSQSEFTTKKNQNNKLRKNILYHHKPLSIFDNFTKPAHFNALKIDPSDLSEEVVYTDK